MTKIKTISSKVESLEVIVEEIVSTVENLDFDWCSEPVDVFISYAERAEGMSSEFAPRYEVLVENDEGYFGFHL
jgi:hypothetical protein